jgi:hypothetical protein
MEKYDRLASKNKIESTISALKANGIDAFYLKTKEQAKEKVLELIPQGSEVFTMTSVTLDTAEISKEINESGKYESVRKKLFSMNREKDAREMRKLGAAPDFAIGSAHAVTEDGKIMIASNTGSQLPAYAYGAGKLTFVIGAQKIVKDMNRGFERIYEYVLPLESERAKKAYGVPGSSVNKILIINKEAQPNRISLIIVNEILGF